MSRLHVPFLAKLTSLSPLLGYDDIAIEEQQLLRWKKKAPWLRFFLHYYISNRRSLEYHQRGARVVRLFRLHTLTRNDGKLNLS